MTGRPTAALAATALAVLIGPAAATGLPRDSGEACHASTLALEERDPDASEPHLADDPACRAFAAAFGVLTREPAPASSEAVLDALSLYGEAQGRGPVVPLDAARLEAMLAEIRKASDKPPETAWQRFVRWLREALAEERRRVRDEPGWLRWLGDIPPEAIRAAWWSLFTLMAGSLAWIVLRELRAAGAFSRGTRARATTAAALRAREEGIRAHTLVEIVGLPAAVQASALLRTTIAQLRRTQRLPSDDSLTNGELRARFSASDPAEGALFADIVRAAESQVYGGSPPGEARMRTLIDAAARTGLAA